MAHASRKGLMEAPGPGGLKPCGRSSAVGGPSAQEPGQASTEESSQDHVLGPDPQDCCCVNVCPMGGSRLTEVEDQGCLG